MIRPPTLPTTASATATTQVGTASSIDFAHETSRDRHGRVVGHRPRHGPASFARWISTYWPSDAMMRRSPRCARRSRPPAARATSCAADVTAAEGPAAIVSAARTAFGGIDALVNAAGVIASGSVVDTTDAGWDAMMDVNVRAPFRLIREAAADARRARAASVVNLSSVAGLRSFPGIVSYAVSKAAVDQLTRCAALDLRAEGRPRQRRQSRRRRHEPPSARRHGRGEVRGVPRAIEVHAPARPRGSTRRSRRPHRVSGVTGGRMDHRRDDRH